MGDKQLKRDLLLIVGALIATLVQYLIFDESIFIMFCLVFVVVKFGLLYMDNNFQYVSLLFFSKNKLPPTEKEFVEYLEDNKKALFYKKHYDQYFSRQECRFYLGDSAYYIKAEINWKKKLDRFCFVDNSKQNLKDLLGLPIEYIVIKNIDLSSQNSGFAFFLRKNLHYLESLKQQAEKDEKNNKGIIHNSELKKVIIDHNKIKSILKNL